MKVTYQITDNCRVELDGRDQRSIFEELASLSEVFGENQCGKCKSNDIRYRVRTNKDNDKFYELVCTSCGATMSYGCHKTGGSLFPHKKDSDGKYLPNKGWEKWVPPAQN
jgi:hypothetical protein